MAAPHPLPDPTTDARTTDALRRALTVVGEGGDLPDVVRPLLEILADLTGMEAAYLTRIDWDDEQQLIQLARNDDEAAFRIEEGAVYPWQGTMCRLAMADQLWWNDDVQGTWGHHGHIPEIGAGALVTAVVEAGDDEHPYGTLCAASGDRVEPDPDVLAVVRLFAVLIGDLLERHRLQAELAARAARAERLLEDRIRFAATTRHAMRTPLAVIRGWADTLERDTLTDEQRHEGFAAIRRGTDRLMDQVEDALAADRQLAGRLQPEHVDVGALARGLAPALGGRPYEVAGQLHLRTDREGVALVVEHLVENTVAHTPEGTPVRVLLAAAGPGGTIVVEDDGPGLPDRDDLFEAFVSADEHNPGSGLGLHIVESVVERLGGSVTTGASESGGARFTVSLPGA